MAALFCAAAAFVTAQVDLFRVGPSSDLVTANTLYRNSDGTADVSGGGRNFSETVPLAPAPAYTGPALYGGYAIHNAASHAYINYDGVDRTGIRDNSGSFAPVADALCLKAGFATGASNRNIDTTVSFLVLARHSAPSRIEPGAAVAVSATLASPAAAALLPQSSQVRAVVKQAGAYFVSDAVITLTSSTAQTVGFSGDTLRNSTWSAYNPFAELRYQAQPGAGILPLDEITFAGVLVTRRMVYTNHSGADFRSTQIAALQLVGETERWTAVPLHDPTGTVENGKDAGRGEGGQVILNVANTPADRSFLAFTTDVAGIYLSNDSGATWRPSNRGLDPSGAAGIAIDPRNARRLLVAGADSSVREHHGLFLTTDQGLTWKRVLTATTRAHRDYREQIAYASALATGPHTTRVYWSPELGAIVNGVTNPGLFTSTDGGETWTLLPNTAAFAGAEIKCHPTLDVLVIATGAGLYRTSASAPGNYVQILDAQGRLNAPITTFDFDDSTDNGLHVAWREASLAGRRLDSRLARLTGWNGGALTFTERPLTGVAGSSWQAPPYAVIRALKVNPYNAQQLVFSTVRDGNELSGDAFRWFSHDGGNSGTLVRNANEDATIKNSFSQSPAQRFGDSFLPANPRRNVFTWYARGQANATEVQKNTVWSNGGDFMTRSTNAGMSYAWYSTGYNGTAITYISLNPYNLSGDLIPATGQLPLLTTNQDYNGAFSADEGDTWQYLDFSGASWGGFAYGGIALGSDIMIVRERQNLIGTRIINGEVKTAQVDDKVIFRIRRGVRNPSTGNFVWSTTTPPPGPAIPYILQKNNSVLGPAGTEVTVPDYTGISVDGSFEAFVNPREYPAKTLSGTGAVRRIFVSSRYSDDLGLSWTPMLHNGQAISVLATDPASGELIGGRGIHLYRSATSGETWTLVGSLPLADNNNNAIRTVAYDHLRNRYYVATNEHLAYRWERGAWTAFHQELPLNSRNQRGARFFAVDPANPDVVYAGGGRNTYRNSQSLVRSLAAGAAGSWETLTRGPDNLAGPDGGRDTGRIVIHPHTREVWAAGGCAGVWRYSAPSTARLVWGDWFEGHPPVSLQHPGTSAGLSWNSLTWSLAESHSSMSIHIEDEGDNRILRLRDANTRTLDPNVTGGIKWHRASVTAALPGVATGSDYLFSARFRYTSITGGGAKVWDLRLGETSDLSPSNESKSAFRLHWDNGALSLRAGSSISPVASGLAEGVWYAVLVSVDRFNGTARVVLADTAADPTVLADVANLPINAAAPLQQLRFSTLEDRTMPPPPAPQQWTSTRGEISLDRVMLHTP
jgi:hypothetical protein